MTSIRSFEHAGWEAAASTFDGFASVTTLFVDPLLKAAHIKPNMRVLDIACGTGVASARAAALGATVTGVDFSAAMIAEARRRHPAITFTTGDAEALLLPDASFDAVVANFGIHHVERPERAIGEARRVLKAGGAFAFTFWAAWRDNTPWRLIMEAVAAHGRLDVPMPAGDSTSATPETFSRLAAQAGFDAASIRTERIEKLWRLPRDADLAAIFETGTVRTATLLRGQGDALPAVRARIAQELRPYERGGVIELPTRAGLLTATAR